MDFQLFPFLDVSGQFTGNGRIGDDSWADAGPSSAPVTGYPAGLGTYHGASHMSAEAMFSDEPLMAAGIEGVPAEWYALAGFDEEWDNHQEFVSPGGFPAQFHQGEEGADKANFVNDNAPVQAGPAQDNAPQSPSGSFEGSDDGGLGHQGPADDDEDDDSESFDSPESLAGVAYAPLPQYTPPPVPSGAPQPSYPPYAGYFKSSEEAKVHRRRVRVAAKSQAPDVERVKYHGRQYWVQRIYESIIFTGDAMDSKKAVHLTRLQKATAFTAADIEAKAHHIFDSALAVHERGWIRPQIYHKKVKRGKLLDISEKSLESRLSRICFCLRRSKAVVDDAMRGGVPLALLCDNPEARSFTKQSNSSGNSKRGKKLELVKKLDDEKALKLKKAQEQEQQSPEPLQEQELPEHEDGYSSSEQEQELSEHEQE
ncbi:hypothetical protein GQ44DRAFT_366446 [Phaeosphaeriaceae sp. PMI808]|nr:hypothetical protein GQ44DRAFT_366446 [Phaeosphaeriaceae sp. PMI808]